MFPQNVFSLNNFRAFPFLIATFFTRIPFITESDFLPIFGPFHQRKIIFGKSVRSTLKVENYGKIKIVLSSKYLVYVSSVLIFITFNVTASTSTLCLTARIMRICVTGMKIKIIRLIDCMVALVLGHINYCRSFNAKSFLYKYIKYRISKQIL